MHPYANPAYAAALSHWGKALTIPEWNTSVIMRNIPAGGVDAAGVYPIAVLSPDADIAGGLARLREAGAVSVVLVLDDFHRPSIEALEKHFTVTPFKTHYVYKPANGAITYDTHHKRALRKAQSAVRAGVLDLKRDWRQWQGLYDHLIAELQLTGVHAFPASYHEAIAQLDGMVAIGVWDGDELVSAHLWACDEKTAHSHLVASSQKGYELRAAYAANDFSIMQFADKRMINFGGGAGGGDAEGDGLARFKRGFSNATARSYIAGAVLDEARYQQLSQGKNTGYFPAYRAP